MPTMTLALRMWMKWWRNFLEKPIRTPIGQPRLRDIAMAVSRPEVQTTRSKTRRAGADTLQYQRPVARR